MARVVSDRIGAPESHAADALVARQAPNVSLRGVAPTCKSAQLSAGGPADDLLVFKLADAISADAGQADRNSMV